ncbi:ABC-F family ATP-binding cassette domain-containing protein [Candidatus Saccharibacteria bacterium]|nr:ABC-F family ATP-binding cassette domain-containing protein [Candidatus Saccharibacteria bacterium]
MILQADIQEKTLGSKLLLKNLNLMLQEKQKVAIIGRNGVGKSTLLGVLSGDDDEYIGVVQTKKGTVIGVTRQEHNEVGDMTVIAYILSELPEYIHLKNTIEEYPDLSDPSEEQLHAYSDAIERFGVLDYYRAEDKVLQELDRYQISEEMSQRPLRTLSGGQKRFVELVKIAESHVDLALIDEPTNHMDYVAKAEFITWLNAASCAVVMVSHDRDVLAGVDMIIEIKDHKAVIFNGNYDAYLKQNSHSTLQGIDQYEIQLKTMANLKKQLQEANRKKAGSSKTPNPFIPMIRRFQKDIDELEKSISKPSFWVDQDSMEGQQTKVIEKYDKYKAQNIKVKADSIAKHSQQLLAIHGLSLGYTVPLFDDITALLNNGDRVEIRGRNGAGKSTLVKAILDYSEGKDLQCTSYAGYIEPSPNLKVGYYEQEISSQLLPLSLAEAIERVYRDADQSINIEKIMQLAHQYLFEPERDLKLSLEKLSGGQKARFQLIKMLCGDPNLLVLDEPTNHLDLPSIEELEKALLNYSGAILYVTHDNYFRDKLKGQIIQI